MIQNLRLYSGLTMFAYVLTHLLNHAAGIVSPELMETVGEYTTEIWQFPLLEILLLAALVTHFLLATARLTSRRTLRLRKSEWAQMILGLCIPFLLFRHIIATRIIDLGFDVASPFERVLLDLAVFIPFQGILQAITVIVVWAHGCIGIHFWLRVKPFYPKWRNTLGTLSILIPTLALAGYGAAAAEVIRRAEEGGRKYVFGVLDAANVNQAAINFYENAILPFSIISIALALAPFGVRQIRQTIDRVRRGPMLSLPNGRFVRVPPVPQHWKHCAMRASRWHRFAADMGAVPHVVFIADQVRINWRNPARSRQQHLKAFRPPRACALPARSDHRTTWRLHRFCRPTPLRATDGVPVGFRAVKDRLFASIDCAIRPSSVKARCLMTCFSSLISSLPR